MKRHHQSTWVLLLALLFASGCHTFGGAPMSPWKKPKFEAGPEPVIRLEVDSFDLRHRDTLKYSIAKLGLQVEEGKPLKVDQERKTLTLQVKIQEVIDMPEGKNFSCWFTLATLSVFPCMLTVTEYPTTFRLSEHQRELVVKKYVYSEGYFIWIITTPDLGIRTWDDLRKRIDEALDASTAQVIAEYVQQESGVQGSPIKTVHIDKRKEEPRL